MKEVILKNKVALLLTFLLTSVYTFAQDKVVDVNISTNKGGGFFSTPWVWVLGAAVFILLLVALLRGGKKD